MRGINMTKFYKGMIKGADEENEHVTISLEYSEDARFIRLKYNSRWVSSIDRRTLDVILHNTEFDKGEIAGSLKGVFKGFN